MLAKLRRITCLVLIIAFVMVAFTPVMVNASAVAHIEETAPQFIEQSNNTLYTTCGAQASTELCQNLAKYNICVKSDTLIEAVATFTGNETTALVITNSEETRIERSIITAIGADGNQQSLISTTEGGSWTLSPLNDSFVLIMMVEYREFSTNTLGVSYYQPVNAMYIYYNPDNIYTVNSIRIDYLCWGTEMAIVRNSANEIIGYSRITNWQDSYEHYITVNPSSPRPRTYYSGNNPYRTDRVIDTQYDNAGSHMLYYDIRLVRCDDPNQDEIALYSGMEVSRLA